MESKESFLFKNIKTYSESGIEIDESSMPKAASFGGIFIKTLYFLLLLGIGAVASFSLPISFEIGIAIAFILLIVGIGVGILNIIFSKQSIVLTVIFGSIAAFFIGAFLCYTSNIVDSIYPGIVSNAVLSTGATFVTCLIIYCLNFSLNFRRITKFILISLISITIFELVMTLGYFLKNQYMLGYFSTPMQIFVSVICVLLACGLLIGQFDDCFNKVNSQCEKQYEWLCAFGLTYSIIYIYIQILRLLLIIASKAKDD